MDMGIRVVPWQPASDPVAQIRGFPTMLQYQKDYVSEISHRKDTHTHIQRRERYILECFAGKSRQRTTDIIIRHITALQTNLG